MAQHIVANDNTFGYELRRNEKSGIVTMVVLAVDYMAGGDPLLLNRETVVFAKNVRDAEREDYERFRIHYPNQ